MCDEQQSGQKLGDIKPGGVAPTHHLSIQDLQELRQEDICEWEAFCAIAVS